MHSYHIKISVVKETESPNQTIPKLLFATLPGHNPRQNTLDLSPWHTQERGGKSSTIELTQKHNSYLHLSKKDYRFGPISVDWLDTKPASSKKKRAAKSKTALMEKQPNSPTSTPLRAFAGKEKAAAGSRGGSVASFTQNISSGTTNLPQGTVHVFREMVPPSTDDDASPSKDTSIPMDAEKTLAVLAVPSYMTPADFLTFVGPAEEGIAHLRMIRDASPNRSIVLVKFRSQDSAEEFAEVYNGRAFNSMEPEICHVVRVLSVTIDSTDQGALMTMPAFGKLPEPSSPTPNSTIYELPTCPVCLERMDSAVTGLVTVPCSHTFHCMCLSKWGDSRCPVCRYSQTLLSSHPPSASSRPPFAGSLNLEHSSATLSTCRSCSSSTNLWICLICGNVGCGRYRLAHAHAHYEATTHLYALELETQRVWDYAGDGYVHRLIQNKTDGKLVELPSASSMTTASGDGTRGLGPGPADALAAEKIEAIGIEYSYLLTSQLDSQRAFYEEQLKALESKLTETMDEQKAREDKYLQLEREKTKSDKKVEKVTEIARRLEKELRDERAVAEGLLKNLNTLKSRVDESSNERQSFASRVSELEDQLRDVMFFLEARDKIEASGADSGIGEAAGGSLVLPRPPKERKGRK